MPQSTPALLQRALKAVADDTFNAITVDGECSTNDCVFALANGASGVRWTRATTPLLVEALAARVRAAGGRHRSRRRGGDQAGDRPRHRRGLGRRRQARRARDRELAAGQDRDPWRRSELGPPGRGRGPFGIRFRARRAPPCGSDRWSCSAAGRRTTSARPRPPSISRATISSSRSIMGTGGSGSSQMWTCDLSAEYVRINAEYRT